MVLVVVAEVDRQPLPKNIIRLSPPAVNFSASARSPASRDKTDLQKI
ncbi:MAG: hypothetical protein RI962_1222 [Pseudomonadota bacterium]|jgi:hypothetical protein